MIINVEYSQLDPLEQLDILMEMSTVKHALLPYW